MRQVSGFLQVLRFLPPIKLTQDITEILLSGVKCQNPDTTWANKYLNGYDGIEEILFWTGLHKP